MRDMPDSIDGVAMKSPADMIVNSTRRHLPQGHQHHFQSVLARIRTGVASIKTDQKIQRYRPRKSGCATKSAIASIKGASELLISRFQNSRTEFFVSLAERACGLPAGADDFLALLVTFCAVRLPRACNS